MKFNPNYKITPSLANQLLEIERHKEAIHILPVTVNLIASLRETARLMSTHYSTQMEGNMLNSLEVEQIVKGSKGGFLGRERDEREVRNYFRALEYVESELKKGSDLSEVLIKRVNGLVLLGSDKERSYREGQNVIKDGATGTIVYMPPEASDVSALMKSLTEWTREQMEMKVLPAPVIAGILHYQFATIHPYYDGNGRTARLLTTFVLHKMGYGMKGIYSLEEYYAKNLGGYYKALSIGNSHNYYMGRAEADITPFLDYFLSAMSISFRRVREKAEQMKDLSEETQKTQESLLFRELRPKQRDILSLFTKQKEVTAIEIAQHLGVKLQNVRTLVKRWLDVNFIQIENSSKRSRTYILNKKWEDLILSRADKRLLELKKNRQKNNQRGLGKDLEY